MLKEMVEYFVFCLEIKKFRLKQCDNDNNEKKIIEF